MTNLRGTIPLDDACRLIGWVDDDSGEPERADRRRLQRLLQAEETKRGLVMLIEGAGKRQGATTLRALDTLGLIPEKLEVYGELKEALAELRDRSDAMEAKVEVLREQAVENLTEIDLLKKARSRPL